MHWLLHLIGADNVSGTWYGFWSGFGSDLGEVALIGGVIEFARRAKQRHQERLTQADRHQTERLDQASEHHKVMKTQSDRQHQQRLDQADAHHDALKAHITAQTPTPAAVLITPEPKTRKPPATAKGM